MSWLPSFEIIGWCISDDAEYEGWVVSIKWRSFIVEFAIGKVAP